MALRLRTLLPWLPLAVVITTCVAYLDLHGALGDYGHDAGPALDALAAGRIDRFLLLQPLMGLVSVVLRLPFVVAANLAGSGDLWRYRAGALPCVLAPAALAVWLVRLRRLSPRQALPVAALALLTPACVAAVRWGHPEEIVGGVLCVAALLLAPRRPLWAGVVLGLAVATKQWALLAVPPVLLAAPAARRWRALACAVGTAELLTLPLFLGNTSAFTHVGNMAATSAPTAEPATVWFPLAHARELWLHGSLVTTFYDIPAAVTHASHPLILLLSPLLTFVAWRRRGDALALLALVLLVRCAFDPVDNIYYHVPFVLALLAWEVLRGRVVPPLTLLACAGLWLTFDAHLSAPATNAVYLAWTAAIGLRLLLACARVAWAPSLERERPGCPGLSHS